MRVRARESVTERDVSSRRDAEQAESRAARPGLARTLVDFPERLAHIREAVVTIGEGRREVVLREIAELGEDVDEPVFAKGVTARGR